MSLDKRKRSLITGKDAERFLEKVKENEQKLQKRVEKRDKRSMLLIETCDS